MFAIRTERDYVINEDFMKAVRKVGDNKKLETKMDYKNVWTLLSVLYSVITTFVVINNKLHMLDSQENYKSTINVNSMQTA